MAGRKDDGSLDPNAALAQAFARRFDATAGYKNILDERGNALLSVNEQLGPRSKAYRSLEERLRTDEMQLERIKMAVRRPISRWQVRPAVLILIAVGLAFLEAPANKFLFDVALQSSGFVSYAVSVGVTVFLLLLAHFAGRSIRQVWSDVRRRVLVGNILVGIGCLLVAAFIVSVLTVARATFATQSGSIGDLLSGVQGQFGGLGPFGALAAALSDTSALVLACINLGGIVTTLMLAFFSHDPDRDFDHAQNAVDQHEKAMERVHNRYLRERARIIKRYAADLVGFAANYNTANSRVIELKTRMQLPLDENDRFVLTDLDQMSEDAERTDEDNYSTAASEPVEEALAATAGVTPMRNFRRATGTEGA